LIAEYCYKPENHIDNKVDSSIFLFEELPDAIVEAPLNFNFVLVLLSPLNTAYVLVLLLCDLFSESNLSNFGFLVKFVIDGQNIRILDCQRVFHAVILNFLRGVPFRNIQHDFAALLETIETV
jgi:hypothetical protein